jgi:hypothetical protein
MAAEPSAGLVVVIAIRTAAHAISCSSCLRRACSLGLPRPGRGPRPSPRAKGGSECTAASRDCTCKTGHDGTSTAGFAALRLAASNRSCRCAAQARPATCPQTRETPPLRAAHHNARACPLPSSPKRRPRSRPP